jgi:hypothetical protein
LNDEELLATLFVKVAEEVESLHDFEKEIKFKKEVEK